MDETARSFEGTGLKRDIEDPRGILSRQPDIGYDTVLICGQRPIRIIRLGKDLVHTIPNRRPAPQRTPAHYQDNNDG